MAAALPMIALATTAIGTGVSTFGAIMQGKREAEAAKAQAKLSAFQADAEIKRGDREEESMRREASRLVGQQRAAYAAAGVRLTGSPLLVMAQTIQDSEQDILALQKETDARALSYRMQSRIFEDTATQATTSSYFKAGSTILTGLGSGIQTWKGMKKGG